MPEIKPRTKATIREKAWCVALGQVRRTRKEWSLTVFGEQEDNVPLSWDIASVSENLNGAILKPDKTWSKLYADW